MKEHKYLYSMWSGDTDKLFSWETAALALVGLCINLFLANLVKWMGLPLYIDNVGSVLVGALGGPIPGMTVGFLSNVINSLGDPITMYYGILTIIMALMASFYTRKGFFRNWKKCLVVIVSFMLVGGGVGSVMTWLLYGGGIGGIGAPFARYLHGMGISAFFSQLLADIFIDLPDKTITVFLAVLLLKVCCKYFPAAFPLSRYYGQKDSEKIQEDTDEEVFYRRYSVKTWILKLIISCSVWISLVTICISYMMYCKTVPSLDKRLTYLIQLLSVSFAITLMICVVTIWLATKKIVEPIGQIVQQSREFRQTPSQDWLDSELWNGRTLIQTGDEIEELYRTICAEQETVARNVMQMKETEEKLRHSRELEDALENARQASQAKGQFLSRMSHEIRTPLNAVIGYMSIAKDSIEQPEKMLHCVENSEFAAKHLLDIINDVLDISSIESGKMKLAREEFNLKAQITTLSTLFYNECKEKSIHFETTIRELTDEWVIGDYLRMNQILTNLLSNAVKFTPKEGSVSLNVMQMNKTEKNIFLKFMVCDTGIGISEEFQKHLFMPFEQESALTAQKYGGTGLGLSITGNLVSMMGGAIDVSSIQGQGSTFTVTIPFEISSRGMALAGAENYKRLRALVLGESEENCEYVKKLLKRCGVKSDLICSEDMMFRQLKKREDTEYSYDFCMLDWKMSGVEVIRRLKQEAASKLKIIVVAYDTTEIQEQAKEAGADQLIAKPLFQSAVFDFLVSTYGKYEPKKKKAGQSLGLAGIHVLLAEDNAMNREIAVDILEKADIIVDTVENGREAVETFKRNVDNYQAILMDIQMPVMDGYEATKTIRALPLSRARTIPIIAMTANAFHEDVAAALASGMNEHIAKPIDYDKLFGALQKASNGFFG